MTLYHSFVPFQGKGTLPTGATHRETACSSTKTALPIPGYILGFVKNPQVMTYYALKGEANYTGLFFPFSSNGIKLSAYSAAKPFGGRIGPRLFAILPNNEEVVPRKGTPSRSNPYISGFDISSFVSGGSLNWDPKYPLPFVKDSFWLSPGGGSSVIGGSPARGGNIFFVIPNLIYDFGNIGDIGPMDGRPSMDYLQPATSLAQSENVVEEKTGLYSSWQYEEFRKNLFNVPGTVYDQSDLDKSFANVRRPTRYEALNYLIPTLENLPMNH